MLIIRLIKHNWLLMLAAAAAGEAVRIAFPHASLLVALAIGLGMGRLFGRVPDDLVHGSHR